MNENQAFVCSLVTNFRTGSDRLNFYDLHISNHTLMVWQYQVTSEVSQVKKYACFGDSITSDQVSGIGTL